MRVAHVKLFLKQDIIIFILVAWKFYFLSCDFCFKGVLIDGEVNMTDVQTKGGDEERHRLQNSASPRTGKINLIFSFFFNSTVFIFYLLYLTI